MEARMRSSPDQRYKVEKLRSWFSYLLLEPPQEEPQRLGIRSMGLAAWPDANILAEMAQRIDAGKIQVFVNRIFPLEEANAAMAYRLETREPGKVVLKVL